MPCNTNIQPPDWCKCKFSAAELHGKSVQFKVRVQNGIESGKGKLVVEPGSGGFVRAAVQFLNQSTITHSHDNKGAIIASGRIELIALSQFAVDAITKNQSGSECDFSIVAA